MFQKMYNALALIYNSIVLNKQFHIHFNEKRDVQSL